MSLLSTLLVTLAGLSLAAMVVSVIIASRSTREARTTIFPIVREEETIRARRARVTTSVTGVIAAIMAGAFFLSGQFTLPTTVPQSVAQGELLAPAEATIAMAAPTENPLPPATEPSASDEGDLATIQTPPAAVTSPAGEVLPPTATPTPSNPIPTPASPSTPTPVPPSPTPAGTPVPAPAGAQMGPIAFTAQITDRREPISPTTVFSDTVSRVYAAFPYRGMRNGLTWTQVWYFNGVEFNRGQDAWTWGSIDRSYVFTRLVGAGTYRLELFVNDDLLTSGEFIVQGPVAVGGPESP